MAYAYNVDYWTGGSSIALATDMLKLRYANYPKDYFMGMLPNSQYGSVAVLPPFNQSLSSRRIVPVLSASGTNHLRASGNNTNEVSMTSPVNSAASLGVNTDLSALSNIVTGKQIGRAHV